MVHISFYFMLMMFICWGEAYILYREKQRPLELLIRRLE